MVPAIAAYLIVVVLMSLASFLAYGWDKWRAQNGGRRVPERTLHLMAFFGGWPGAWLGQQQFRHKTQKVSFRIVFWLLVWLHVGIVSSAAYYGLTARRDITRPTNDGGPIIRSRQDAEKGL